MISEIIKNKFTEVAGQKALKPLAELKNEIKGASRGNLFKQALIKQSEPAIIAELKKASPSKGILRDNFKIEEIAKIYADNGVSALSVLTEKKYFLGDKDYIRQLRKLVDLPLLQKDFFIDAYQIYEAAALGADCILLIASILSKEELFNFLSIAKENNLSALVEVHNEQDLDKALECKAEIIGINNRNLETFKVNIETSLKLLPLIPSGLNIIKVSESGINTFEDLIRLKDAGVDAVLIGESFMTCDDIKDKINALRGI
jgi:indole-3-glycerol phosphate synthase